MTHIEAHKSHRVGWLRAAVLGANDGIVSTSSLIIGVASANVAHNEVVLAGLAGLVAGAMSMAAGEYVSVSSQSDTEKADLEIERQSLEDNFDSEVEELAEIYRQRGLTQKLSKEVAEQLMAHDALAAHARDEIGISQNQIAKPIQAAYSSALTFTLGASLPLAVAWLTPSSNLTLLVAISSLLCLMGLGIISARVGGASMLRAAIRVTFWGALAMLITAGVGHLFGVMV